MYGCTAPTAGATAPPGSPRPGSSSAPRTSRTRCAGLEVNQVMFRGGPAKSPGWLREQIRWRGQARHRRRHRPLRLRGLSSRTGQLDQPAPPGDRGRLGATGRTQLAEDVGDVDADGLGADEQLLADLAVGAALGHQREDLASPGRSACRRRRRRGPGRCPSARSSSSSGRAPSRCAASRAASATSRAAAGSPVDAQDRRPGPPAPGPARARHRSPRRAPPPRARCRPARPAAGRPRPASQRARSVSASSRFIQARPSGPQKPDGSV